MNIKNAVLEFLIENDGKPKDYKWIDVAYKFNAYPDLPRRLRAERMREIDRARKRKLRTNTGRASRAIEMDKHKFIGKPANNKELRIGYKRPPKVHTVQSDGVYVILGCVHVPFHDRDLFISTLSLIDYLKPAGIVLLGDFLDMNTLSSYDRGQVPIQGITLGYEYDEGNKALDQLQSVLPVESEKVYLYGNHEHRYHKFMKDVNNSKLQGGVKSPVEGLKLKERGYAILDNWEQDEVEIANYRAIHGVFCSTHPAKKHLDVFKRNMLFAHTHRINSHIEGINRAYNIGWMGDVNTTAFTYATKSQRETWCKGFAVMYKEGNHAAVQQVTYDNFSIRFGDKSF